MSSSNATTIHVVLHRSSRRVWIEDSTPLHVLQYVHADALSLPGCAVDSNRPCLFRQSPFEGHASHGNMSRSSQFVIVRPHGPTKWLGILVQANRLRVEKDSQDPAI